MRVVLVIDKHDSERIHDGGYVPFPTLRRGRLAGSCSVVDDFWVWWVRATDAALTLPGDTGHRGCGQLACPVHPLLNSKTLNNKTRNAEAETTIP